MRTDCKIDGRKVVCSNSSMIGYSTVTARVGSFLVYSDGARDGQSHMARMIGRVKFAPALSGDIKPVKNWILALVLSARGSACFERWIDPSTVTECYDNPPAALTAFFFAPKLPYDAQTLRRLAEHGTLQDAHISQHAERAAQFRAADARARNPGIATRTIEEMRKKGAQS